MQHGATYSSAFVWTDKGHPSQRTGCLRLQEEQRGQQFESNSWQAYATYGQHLRHLQLTAGPTPTWPGVQQRCN